MNFFAMKEIFRSITILYFSLIVGLVAMSLVVFYLIQGEEPTEAIPMAGTLIPLVILAGLGGAWFMNQQRIQEGLKLDGLEEKLIHYRATVIIRSALIEGTCLMAVVFAMLNSSPNYLAFVAIGLLGFLYFRPTVDKFAQEYNLTSQEANELR